MKFAFHATRSASHFSFPYSLSVRWGKVAVGLAYKWRFVFALTAKIRWIEYAIGFSLYEELPPSASLRV